MTRWWLALALLGLLVGARGTAEATMADEREDAVIEAAYRALLVEAAPPATETVCLVVRRTVEGKEQMGDPSDALLARLQKQNAKLRRESECEQPDDGTQIGPLVIDIGPVKFTGEDAARTGAGFSRGRMSTFEVEYELARTSEGWRITKTSRGPVI